MPLAGHSWQLHIAVLVTCAAAFAMFAVRQLDINVYHKMLRGAVTFGEDFEQQHLLPLIGLEKGMTQAISHFSRIEDAKAVKTSSPFRYVGTSEITALDKIKNFYFNVIATLLFVALVILVITNLQSAAHLGGM